MRSEAVVVDGVRSPVASAGDTARDEAVVFLHGNPGAACDWDALLPQVGAFARAIAPEMPGYGKADRPRRFDYTVAGYARHLDGILKQLRVRRAGALRRCATRSCRRIISTPRCTRCRAAGTGR